MVKLADEAEAAGKAIRFTDFELPRVTILNGAGKRIKGREMDLSVEIDGVEYFYEMKAWDPNLLVDRLIKSLRGKTDDLDEIKEADQFQADLMDMILRSMPGDDISPPDLSLVNKRWRFDGRAHAAGISSDDLADVIVDHLSDPDNANFTNEFRKRMAKDGFYHEIDRTADKLAAAEFDKFVEGGDFRSILVTMFEVLP